MHSPRLPKQREFVLVVWPDGPRRVATDKIVRLAQDCWANNADWSRCCLCGENCRSESNICEHDDGWTPVYDDGSTEPKDLDDAVALLEDAGAMTFGRDGPFYDVVGS